MTELQWLQMIPHRAIGNLHSKLLSSEVAQF
jgi:hypothetical protein